MYKKLKVFCWIIILIGFFAFYIFTLWIPAIIATPYIALSFCVLYPPAIALIMRRIAKKQFKKLQMTLTEECDPVLFIKKATKLLKNASINSIYISLRFQICIAYLYIRQFDKAKEILENCAFPPDNRSGKMNQLLYYDVYYKYYLYQNELFMAESVLKDIEHFLNGFLSAEDEKLPFVLKSYTIPLNMKKGIYEGAEHWYLYQFSNAQNRVDKVFSQFELGKIYLHDERIKESKDAFAYVIRYGNTLSVVQEAKQNLMER